MPASAPLEAVAVVGFAAAVVGAAGGVYRGLPVVYPRGRTRLDERSYALVRGALALGLVVGLAGAVLALVDTVGTIRALRSGRSGLLAVGAVLIPDRLGPAMVRAGVALLVGGAVVAAAVEIRAALD